MKVALSRYRAILLVACSAILFSTAGILIKLLTVGPMALSGGRSFVAAVVIFLWLRRPHFSWSRAQIGGAVALAATQMLFVIATRETSAANAVFIQFTAPVYVAFLGKWFLREHPRRADWLTMAAIGAGLYFFFEGELSLRGAWGNLIATSEDGLFDAIIVHLNRYSTAIHKWYRKKTALGS